MVFSFAAWIGSLQVLVKRQASCALPLGNGASMGEGIAAPDKLKSAQSRAF